jgi:hypothetical protein
MKEFVKGIPHRRDAEAQRRSKNSIEKLCKGKATEQRGVKPTAFQKLHVPSDSRLSLSVSAFLRVSAVKAIDFFTASESRDPARAERDRGNSCGTRTGGGHGSLPPCRLTAWSFNEIRGY